MKFKTLILLGASTLAVGATSLAIVAKYDNSAVAATDSSTYYLLGSMTNWESNDSYAFTQSGSNYTLTVTLAKDVQFKSRKGTSWGTDELGASDTITSNGWFSGSTRGNITVVTAGTYTFIRSSSAWISVTQGNNHTVSEYQVIDGDVQSSTFATLTIADGESCDLSSVTPTLSNAAFIGWYSDSACTTVYTTQVITADKNVYARFVSNICLEGSVVGWGNTTTYLFTYDSTAKNYSYQKSFAVNEEFKIHNIRTDKWLGIDSSIFTSDNFSGTDNIVTKTADTYTLVCTSTSGTLAWVSCTGSIVQYTISEYEVVDGVLNSTAIATQKATSGTAFTPTDIAKTGYTLNGWYTDSACTSAYTATTWSADGSLYAKYTEVVYDSYVYFSAPSWTSCYAYTFKNGNAGQFGAWPGTKMTSVTDGVSYQGSGIYRVGYNSTVGDTGIVFNKGTGGTKGTDQTYDLTLTAGMFYKLADQSTGDADKGSGAKVVYDINIARRAISASSGILAGSLCGISKANAQTLINEYDALNATAQGYVNAATDYTYNYTDKTGATNVDVAVNYMVAQLRVIAAGSGSAYYVDNLNASNILVYSILGVVGALSVGGFFFFQKKRREEIR